MHTSTYCLYSTWYKPAPHFVVKSAAHAQTSRGGVGFASRHRSGATVLAWGWLSYTLVHSKQYGAEAHGVADRLRLAPPSGLPGAGQRISLLKIPFPNRNHRHFFFFSRLSESKQDLKAAEADRRERAATSVQATYRGWEGRQIAGDRYTTLYSSRT